MDGVEVIRGKEALKMDGGEAESMGGGTRSDDGMLME